MNKNVGVSVCYCMTANLNKVGLNPVLTSDLVKVLQSTNLARRSRVLRGVEREYDLDFEFAALQNEVVMRHQNGGEPV